jgi:hypothetical protein
MLHFDNLQKTSHKDFQGQANHHSATQDLDQALTYCVNMVQQISYTQEMKDLMEQQEVASTRYLKTLHPFIDQEGHLRVGG